MAYTKLFHSILDSTVWDTDPPTKVVWITMMAMSDRDGIVEASVPGLAKRAGVSRGECERAIALFSAPDVDSRTREHEGRRIVEVDGGWRLLNYEKYRDRATSEEARAKAAERQKRWRERQKQKARNADGNGRNVTVDAALHDVTRITHSEAEAEAEAEPPSPPGGSGSDAQRIEVIAFASAWRELTGRSDFPDDVPEHWRDTATRDLVDMRRACGGDLAQFRARVVARLDERGSFARTASLKHWADTLIHAPAQPAEEHVPGGAADALARMRSEVICDS